MGPDPGRHQRLVGIAPGGIGDQQLPVLQRPVGKPLRPLVEQDVAGAARVLLAVFDLRDFRLTQVTEVKALLRLDARVTVDRGVTDQS